VTEELRPLLFGIAYRMVGEVGAAEDIVQEAYLRRHGEEGAVRSERAFLTTVTTRLAIDHLRSARVRRESYVGPWLPEPLVEASGDDPAAHAELADSLSLAFLVLLERLSPVERAVFLLHEAFGHSHDEIAAVVGKTPENCRQLLRRARQHVEAERPRFDIDRDEHRELTRRFAMACAMGDADGLLEMLAPDVVASADGGGKFNAARRPVAGAARVAKMLLGITRRRRDELAGVEEVDVNGRPGLLLRRHDGSVQSVVTVDVAGGRIQAIHTVVNPDKLARVA
jgi:RNA polymerase sigma-70 factor (ECF subfamily)